MLQSEREEKATSKLTNQMKQEALAPKTSTPSAFAPAGGSSFQPVRPVPVSSNNSAFAGSGAFCPIPKKPEPKKELGEPRIPSAFSSPATHFKPIILHQPSATTNEKQATVTEEKNPVVKDKEKTTPSKTSSSDSSKKAVTVSPDQTNDKEKEVVKKLKELKKNLMKHNKQPSMAKELENEDKLSEASKDSKDSKNSTPSRKSLPPTPKKSSSSKSGEKSKRRQSSGALDALLKEIQKQGNVPDTNSLASAIAQVLQNHLNQGESPATKPPDPEKVSDNKPAELDMTVTSAQATINQNEMLQNLNIPQQFHSQLVGQMMSLPMQYGGNMYPSLPQFQFQQDPVTGFLQLVPVPVSVRPQSVHSNSGSVHSGQGFTSPAGSGTKDLGSPNLSPKTYHNQSDVSNPSAISDQSLPRGKVPHGRTAKDLVQKTANMRAKNLGRPSPSNVLSSPQQTGLHKWKSDLALDRAEAQFYSDSERTKHSSYSSLSFQNRLQSGYVFDDSMLNPHSYRNAHMTGLSRPLSHYGNGMLQYRSPDYVNRQNINSTASSPSPSTHDSGIGGMNHGNYNRGIPPTSDTLMERLLSNVNMKQQRVLGKIVHLLREEFAFDGYMENGVEDLAMG